MGITIHWGGAGDGGIRWYQGEYHPPPEQCHTIHCDLYYNGIVSDGVAEARNVTLTKMVGEDRSIYPSYKSRACSSGDGGGDRDGGIKGR